MIPDEDDTHDPTLAKPGEKDYSQREAHVKTKTLNTNPKYDNGGRAARLWTLGEKAFEQIAAHTFEYKSPIDSKTYTCVAHRMSHRDCHPWNRLAIVEVEIYVRLFQMLVPQKWNLHHEDVPYIGLSLPPNKPNGKARDKSLMLPRLIFDPPPLMYLRWVYSPLLLIPNAYYPVKASNRTKKVRDAMTNPHDDLKIHLNFKRMRYGHGHVELQNPAKFLVKPERVNLTLFATLNDS